MSEILIESPTGANSVTSPISDTSSGDKIDAQTDSTATDNFFGIADHEPFDWAEREVPSNFIFENAPSPKTESSEQLEHAEDYTDHINQSPNLVRPDMDTAGLWISASPLTLLQHHSEVNRSTLSPPQNGGNHFLSKYHLHGVILCLIVIVTLLILFSSKYSSHKNAKYIKFTDSQLMQKTTSKSTHLYEELSRKIQKAREKEDQKEHPIPRPREEP